MGENLKEIYGDLIIKQELLQNRINQVRNQINEQLKSGKLKVEADIKPESKEEEVK